MSYSRWLNSRWYTFWCSTNSDAKDDQVFNIDCDITFTYAELKKDIKECLKKVREKHGEMERWELDEVYRELEKYMRQFMKNVEDDNELT